MFVGVAIEVIQWVVLNYVLIVVRHFEWQKRA